METRAARCPVEDFERGRLPMVCAVTGRPAEGWYDETYESPTGLQYLLLLFGLVPFLIVRAVTRKTSKGRIPVTRATFTVLHDRARRRRRRTVTLLGVGGAAALLGIALLWSAADAGRVLAPLGLVVMAVGVAIDMSPSFLSGHVEPSGRWVVLENAHPAFAAAVEEQVRLG